MKLKKLGKNGPEVSSVGLGCMGMSDFYVSKQTRDDQESIYTIHAALDAGINYLDTGDFYGMGHNESLVGKAIQDRRDQAFLSVKFGAQRSPSGAFLGFDARPNSVKAFAAYSLQRLGVDIIDLYQPARIDPSVPIEETVGAVADLIKEGKVRYLGLSETNSEQIRRANNVHPVSALQIEYSLATRLIESKILPTIRELGISLVPYGIVGRGLLTGSITGEIKTDYRAHLPRFQGENLSKNLEKVATLQSIASAKGSTPSQIAIAWVLSRGEDIIPLIGTSKRSRLSENLKALDIILTSEELEKLDRTFSEGAIVGDRYPAPQMEMVAK
ncbi:oxidoreductase, aldo/keto reductase family protein [Leptospira fainei serovar Hurstbridge str. BUT 6]|uniref:Oxidoreductase, aldo/keto reductase family protein n=1 Tax=Leptospira fainei serovar Hurstbridge str. BUT 6 TaxID=1193011 RepID=S3UWD7_9LEPT|nr:aldo/keto reductase [Leptospira fainei]EPG72664.1 oxidoreductase, aldo/keto reductase family protein [Leptospira fainei serovar Hurstbridge str. BUT 6]